MGIFVPIVVDTDVWDAEKTSKRVIFIRVGRLCRKVTWTTGTMRDLQHLVCREFNAPEDLVQVRAKQNDTNPFILFHSEYGKGYVDAAPLVWPDADLKIGSVVSVRDPLWQATLALCAGEGDATRAKREKNRSDKNMPPLTPQTARSGQQGTVFRDNSERWNQFDDISDLGSNGDGSEAETPSSSGFNSAPATPSANATSKFRGMFSTHNSGLTSTQLKQNKNVTHGDMPANLTKKLAKRAALVSNLDDLSNRERVDVLLNNPQSSPAAAFTGGFFITLIALSTITFCFETLPWYYEPEPPLSDPFWAIEAFCISAFTLELSLRAWATDDRRGFFKKGMNAIDLVAILPFYVDLIARGFTIPGLSVLRVLRLARVFRLLRISKNAVALLGETMARSARPLYILSFLLSMALITFSTVLYFAERGEYDEVQRVWMRTVGYACDFPCTAETRSFTSGYIACGGESAEAANTTTATAVYFNRLEPNVESIEATCTKVVEQTPFQSILHSIWWAVATMGTVGYGDLTPRTVAGWVLASAAQMLGILVIALPITVIGSNFSAIYSSIGTSQSLWAKEHEPSQAVRPRRLHSSATGATASHLTRGWVSPLTHDWDLDVAVAELTPCQPPVVQAEGTGDDKNSPNKSLRSVSTRLSTLRQLSLRRIDFTPEEQLEAFINGESLFEFPSKSGSGGSSRVRSRSATPMQSSGALQGPSLSGDMKEKSRLGNVRSLRTALAERAEETRGGEMVEDVDEDEKIPRLTFKAPSFARRSGKARRAALVMLVDAFLVDCVRNVEIRDKFAATRQRETLRKGDTMFKNDDDDDKKKSAALKNKKVPSTKKIGMTVKKGSGKGKALQNVENDPSAEGAKTIHKKPILRVPRTPNASRARVVD